MESEFETTDGRVLRVRVNNDVVDAGDGTPPIDDHNLDEGATEATILVDPGPNTMTVEGAIAGIGIAARALTGNRPRLHVVESEVEPRYRQKSMTWKRVVFGLVLLGMLLGGSRALRPGL